MSAGRALVVNLDGEDELALGKRWTPPSAMRARMQAIAAAMPLPSDMLRLDPASIAQGEAAGRAGLAFCPTPRALAALARAGASLPAHPSVEVLTRVNERRFAHDLAEPEELAPRLASEDLGEIAAFVARSSPGDGFRLKRGLSAAGRGQRNVRAGPLDEADRAWIRASLRLGALYVEPRVAIVAERSVHGWVRREGAIDVRTVRRVAMGRGGAFVASERVLSGDHEPHRRALEDTAARVGEALARAGYLGPFGVDAFVYGGASGAPRLRALSEVNARYCMGWDDDDGW